MDGVRIIDRSGQEIVVHVSGAVDESVGDTLDDVVTEVAGLVRIGGLEHVVVDMHRVSALAGPGLQFLHDLIERGRQDGFHVSFAAMSGPAHRAVEQAGWPFRENSPPLG